MKEFLIFLPLTIVYLALKSTLFPNLPLPDLPLIMVFLIASRKASIEGAVLAFVLGYLDDAFSGGIIGTSSFALVFIFVTVHLLSRMVQFTTPSIMAGGAALAALLKGALTYAVLRFSNVDVYFLTHVVLQAVITGIFAPGIIAVLQRMLQAISSRKFEDGDN